MKRFVAVTGVVAASILALSQQEPSVPQEHKYPAIPPSIVDEHAELHAELVELTRVEGSVGKAARAVASKLHSHFEKEEALAMPPLGLLVPLSQQRIEPGMKSCLELTERLKRELLAMLEEHRQIVDELDRLAAAGRESKSESAERFAASLRRHARTEEEVLYPAAIVVGELLKLTLKDG
jgi:hypothetical protein